MSYQLTFEQRPGYVHSKVVGERSVENTLRFLHDSYTACVNSGRTALLLEMHLSGPSLTTASMFEVIASWVYEAVKLRKIAYVEGPIDDAALSEFAMTVAVNRGVNMRQFRDVAAAAAWLSEEL
jgi:hypothetical protein